MLPKNIAEDENILHDARHERHQMVRAEAWVEDASPRFPHLAFHRYQVMLACQRLEELTHCLCA